MKDKKKDPLFTMWIPYHTGIQVKVRAATPGQAIELAKELAENGNFDKQLLANVQRDGAIDIVGEEP